MGRSTDGGDGGPHGIVDRVVATLTVPLPAHIAEHREVARSALIFVALSTTLLTLRLPHDGGIRTGAVLLLAATVAATGALSLLRRFHPLLNRVGGLILLGQITLLVHLTGGPRSVYTSLYVLLLLYAAIFYGPARLLATTTVVVSVLWLPLVYGPDDPLQVTRLVVQSAVWIVATGTVHWLVGRMRMSAQTDGLTGLWNHVTFWQLLRTTHEQHARSGRGYSVLLLDLDHFKRVNDTRGHRVGDEVLRTVAGVLRGRCRRSDIVARYGGEEFAVLLPDTGREDAITLARELRLRVGTTTMAMPVTVSIGVAASSDGHGPPDALVGAADRALYEAKAAGRNHVALALPPLRLDRAAVVDVTGRLQEGSGRP